MYHCPHCAATMELDETPGGELAYECTNDRCRFVAHASTAQVSLVVAPPSKNAAPRRGGVAVRTSLYYTA